MERGDISLSPKQRLVLDLLVQWHNGTMQAKISNYKQIAFEVGWKSCSAVPECLFSLREKGVVRSVGPIKSRPVQWEVV